jgi:hypothetical protein
MKHTIAGLALAFAIAGTTGCGGSPKTATAKGATCADAAAHTRDTYMASPDAETATADMMSNVIVERCTTDGWSAEAITCMASASDQEMAACPNKLTQDQRDKFAEAVNAAADQPPANEFDNAGGE